MKIGTGPLLASMWATCPHGPDPGILSTFSVDMAGNYLLTFLLSSNYISYVFYLNCKVLHVLLCIIVGGILLDASLYALSCICL